MALPHEWMFYEVMWRAWARRSLYPLPWWLQQTFRRWIDQFDSGLFDSKEAALSSNALYRYWGMVGVKDASQKSLIGQAGEIEPVYERYAVSFFLLDAAGGLHLPQCLEPGIASPALEQHRQDGYLPIMTTTYRPPMGVQLTQRTLGTTVGLRQRSIVLNRLTATAAGAGATAGWLGVAVSPIKPSGFVRHDRAGRYLADSQLSFLRYLPAQRRVETNTGSGPVFDTAPASYGLYGNPNGSWDPDQYLATNPFADLAAGRALNGADISHDSIAGLCTAAFLWPFDLSVGGEFTLDLRLPVDDFRDPSDFAELAASPASDLEAANLAFWQGKLNGSGLQASLPPVVTHLFDLYRSCRADLLILADNGVIHPGPTIYNSFWIRDSSVEGIACALAGDSGLAGAQFGQYYPTVFNTGYNTIGAVNEHGFFGGDHERNDQEWDANGEALWAFGRFDRIQGAGAAFGAKVYAPYVTDGARWIRDNRSEFGLLPSGWSAEHIGDKDKPHYWDDLWGLAGLYEAARLAERLGRPEIGELWAAFDSLKTATADSIRWVLGQQAAQGQWQTFIPTGPADVGRLDSTIIGALCYFHPTRLYYGAKLGTDIDQAFRMTLDTIWVHFVTGGFRHDAAWHAYGPYLTLQLAHAFLLLGDVDRMDACLAWAVGDAAFAKISRTDDPADANQSWQVSQGAWNEQHAYPIASDLAEIPDRWWYMGDIPHGWAAAEFTLLLRDILFFEAGEDDDPHIYIAPGVMPAWLRGDGGHSVTVSGSPTAFGSPFGYTLRHDQAAKLITIDIPAPVPGVRYIYPCRLGQLTAATTDAMPATTLGSDVLLPAGTRHAEISYI
ncbi:MAG: hypothetical protein ABIZ05_02400 [Pseudonocardiaceae bacterium]